MGLVSSKFTLISNLVGVRATGFNVLSSGLLVTILIASAYTISSLFHLDVYYFEQGVTHHMSDHYQMMINPIFIANLLSICLALWFLISISHKVLSILLFAAVAVPTTFDIFSNSIYYTAVVSLIALPVIGFLFLVQSVTRKRVLRSDASKLLVNYLCAATILLSVISIAFSMNLMGENNGNDDFNDFSYLLVTILAWFSPLIIFLLVFALPLRLIWEEIYRKFRSRLAKYTIYQSQINLRPSTKILAMGVILATSLIIVFVPQFLNGNHLYIGIDTPQYRQAIQNFSSQQTTYDKIEFLFNGYSEGDRPLSIFIISSLISFVDMSKDADNSVLIELLLPPILSVSLCLVIFFLTKEITINDKTALMASFLTSISPQVLIGLYSGFYANWIALIFAFLSVMFMFRYIRKPNLISIVFFTALLVTVMLSHAYTYTIFLLVLSIFLLSSIFFRIYSKKTILILLSVLVMTFVFDLAKSAFIGTSTAIGLDLSVAEKLGTGLDQFSSRWSNLVRTIQVHVGGIYGGSIVVMLMALVGAVLIDKKRNLSVTVLIMSFLSVGILPLFFGDRIVMARILYNIPFQIPAAIVLCELLGVKKLGPLVVISFSLFCVAIAIHYVTNL